MIYSIYGKEIANNIINVDYTYENIHVLGVIGKPEIARSNRSNQLFFVNKRYIKDKILTSSADQAFKSLLPVNKFGFLVLNIEMPSNEVDVNVHPAKLEVRFQDENKIFKAVFHAIKETLINVDMINATERNTIPEYVKPNAEKNVVDQKEEVKINYRPWEEKTSIEKLESVNPTFGTLFKKIIENTKINLSNEIKSEILEEDIEENQKSNVEENVKNNLQKEEIIDKINNNKMTNIENSESKQNDTKNDENIELNNLISIKDEVNNIKKIKNDYFNDTYKIIGINNKNNKEINKNDENIKKHDVIEEADLKNEVIDELVKLNSISEYEELKKEENAETDIENVTNNNIDEIISIPVNKNEKNTTNFDEMYAKMFGIVPKNNQNNNLKEDDESYKIEPGTIENISLFTNDTKTIPIYKYIGICFSSYIIIELDKEIYFINIKNARMRILYEKIKEVFYTKRNKKFSINVASRFNYIK